MRRVDNQGKQGKTQIKNEPTEGKSGIGMDIRLEKSDRRTLSDGKVSATNGVRGC
jgi:hypothetical protein